MAAHYFHVGLQDGPQKSKPQSFVKYMNKSLELNFWPILYDSIVFLCLQTQKVYLKQNII